VNTKENRNHVDVPSQAKSHNSSDSKGERTKSDLEIIHRDKSKNVGKPNRKLIEWRNSGAPVIGNLKASN
jgi:hypothetical protein